MSVSRVAVSKLAERLKSDSAFDDLTASLGDSRPHRSEDALVQLGRALMAELMDVISDRPWRIIRQSSERP